MGDELVQIEIQSYILATSTRADDRTRVLKHDDTFGVFDLFGDVQPIGLGEQGLYHRGTRYLSRLELRLEERRPMLLSSTVREDNELLAVDLTNADVSQADHLVLPRGTVHLYRERVLLSGVAYERIRLTNFGLVPADLTLAIHVDADYADVFEVRGARRHRRGCRLPPETSADDLSLGYEGLDGLVRRTDVRFAPRPQELTASAARYDIRLPPHGRETVFLTVVCREGDAPAPEHVGFDQASAAVTRSLRRAEHDQPEVWTTNQRLNTWVNRSAADLRMMMTNTELGHYPYAGVPWYSAPFGRDGIITAFELLWLDPGVARGVLSFLAMTQASQSSAVADAEPGKILHEMRHGEMAALGEVPFARYYGSVDATPLFVMLAGAYFERTGDRPFIERLWPHVERALGWIDVDGDPDGDGFVEYTRRSPAGLSNHGWKDSHDAIFHADGTLAHGAIALCEVQAYVYAARLAAAELGDALGHRVVAEDERRKASALRRRFDESFWCEDLDTYALALDGEKRPCRVRASNAGHALWAGIAEPGRAAGVARTLFAPESFTGWGIRTLSAGERRYNPMSYHNGSVWPHDNALIAAGLSRYGLQERALELLRSLFHATAGFDLRRVPELFCGFQRRPGEGPTLYPVACSPQAWAAGAVFLLLGSCLGVEVLGGHQEVRLHRPVLPDIVSELRIGALGVGKGRVDLLVERHPHDVGITVLRRDGDVKVVVVK